LAADRSGLLEEDEKKYGFFTHRTFREYLAGYHLAEQLEDSWRSNLKKHLSDDQWQEVVRLAAGFLAFRNSLRADKFIRQLVNLGKNRDLAIFERAHAFIWAAMALSDFPPDRLRKETRDNLAKNMLAMLTANPPCIVEPALRRQLGFALAAIGDPRFDPDLLRYHSSIRKSAKGKYLTGFVPIPGGSFQMGVSDDEVVLLRGQRIEIGNDERPSHSVSVRPFAIGKYQVTNSEFRFFIEDNGYNNADFWSEEGWRWRTGEMETELACLSDEDIKKGYQVYLGSRPKDKRSQPFLRDDPDWNADNCPVVGINWYEANAYCCWLTVKLHAAKILTPAQIIRLPTEAEWEKAAKMGHAIWPWGNVWDKSKCNSLESRLRGTTPVGMYPHGASSVSAPMDLIGNVWEWSADWYNENLYTHRANQGVTSPSGPAEGVSRVLRGGSWRDNRSAFRNTRRRRNFPIFFGYDVGFRLVLAPFGSQ
jgi:formylglycine-generating enzyme required for sulfatase activity